MATLKSKMVFTFDPEAMQLIKRYTDSVRALNKTLNKAMVFYPMTSLEGSFDQVKNQLIEAGQAVIDYLPHSVRIQPEDWDNLVEEAILPAQRRAKDRGAE